MATTHDGAFRAAPCPLATRWATELDPASPLPEHPRPRLMREQWRSLNGLWDYAIRPARAGRPESWDGKILVPFAVESALSGVGRALEPGERLWYRRMVELPEEWMGWRVFLHFEAVDFEAEVFVNGRLAMRHAGGYEPFSVELTRTECATAFGGEAFEIAVAVRDPNDRGAQPRGKQSLKPGGIMYTAVSGIWQTVWLEAVPLQGIADLIAIPLPGGRLRIELAADDGVAYRVRVRGGGSVVAEGCGVASRALELELPDCRPWSPEDPFLYSLEVETEGRDGADCDRVDSYVGHRLFEIRADASGRRRFFLNGEPLFLNAVLDQGYFPDGLYTAPTEEALAFDLKAAKRLGFNAVRKHAKIEGGRWFWHAARLGLLVWQDMPSGGVRRDPFILGAANLLGLRLDDRTPLSRALLGRRDSQECTRYLGELSRAVARLRGETALAAWTIFNEGWGQFESARAVEAVRRADPARPIDAASGWFDEGAGDIDSRHVYFGPFPSPAREIARGGRARRRGGASGSVSGALRVFAVSEYGGLTMSLPGHRWPSRREFGYRRFKNASALTAAYEELVGERLAPLVPEGLAAAVYTQLTDVEQETNGLVSYDRAVFKIAPERVAEVNGRLSAAMRR